MPLSFAPMPRGAFTGFQMIFLFSLSLLPEAESECRVCQPAPWMKQTDTHSRANREEWLLSPGWTSPVGSETFILPLLWFALFTLRWCLFPFGYSFFTDFLLKFFLPNLPPLPFTSIFASFSDAASGSHFRSGRKGNSGIGRKCKVKPPVFGKNHYGICKILRMRELCIKFKK